MCPTVNNWLCPTCSWSSSRRWNVARHIKLVHNASLHPLMGNVVQGAPRSRSIPYKLSDRQNNQNSSISSILGQWGVDMQDWMKTVTTYANSMNSLEAQNRLRQSVSFLSNRLANTRANNCIVPKAMIHGISGYLCPHCLTFTHALIKDPGYDMTEETRHQCDPVRIRNVQTAQPQQLYLVNLEESMLQILTNSLNFYMPGDKYLVALDFTDFIVHLVNKLNYEVACTLIGIPDRWHWYRLEQNYNIDWINSALTNPYKKIRMEDPEVIDFLRRIKATYGIFQIATRTSTKWFTMCITR